MSIINKATKHYADQNRLIIDVPEWDTEIHIFPYEHGRGEYDPENRQQKCQ